MKPFFYCVVSPILCLFMIYLIFKEPYHFVQLYMTGGKAIVTQHVLFEPVFGYKQAPRYSGRFSFVTEGGVAITSERKLPENVMHDFHAHRPVHVLYDPAAPTDFVFEDEQTLWPTAIVLAVFMLIALGMGVLYLMPQATDPVRRE